MKHECLKLKDGVKFETLKEYGFAKDNFLRFGDVYAYKSLSIAMNTRLVNYSGDLEEDEADEIFMLLYRLIANGLIEPKTEIILDSFQKECLKKCKELGYNWIARDDKNYEHTIGELWIYGEKPVLFIGSRCWASDGTPTICSIVLQELLTKYPIEFEDGVLSIDELIGENNDRSNEQ